MAQPELCRNRQHSLSRLAELGRPVFTVEEHVLEGGFGSSVLEYNASHGGVLSIHPIGVKNRFIPQGDHRSLLKEVELDEAGLRRQILDVLKPGELQDER